jgi:hypothetical protein
MDHVIRRRVLAVVFVGLGVALVAGAAVADPARVADVASPKAVAVGTSFDQLLDQQDTLVQRLSPDVRRRLDATGREVFARLAQPARAGAKPKTMLDAARDAAKDALPDLGPLATGDIETLAFVVMMQAAKSAEDDLRGLLAGVKTANASRASHRELRDRIAALRAHRAPDGGSDALADLSSEQQLKMQMYMDRMSKVEAALSNLEKKISDTQSAIIGNLK